MNDATNPNHIYLKNIELRWRRHDLTVVEWIDSVPYELGYAIYDVDRDFSCEMVYEGIKMYLDEVPKVKVLYIIGNSLDLSYIKKTYE